MHSQTHTYIQTTRFFKISIKIVQDFVIATIHLNFDLCHTQNITFLEEVHQLIFFSPFLVYPKVNKHHYKNVYTYIYIYIHIHTHTCECVYVYQSSYELTNLIVFNHSFMGNCLRKILETNSDFIKLNSFSSVIVILSVYHG